MNAILTAAVAELNRIAAKEAAGGYKRSPVTAKKAAELVTKAARWA